MIDPVPEYDRDRTLIDLRSHRCLVSSTSLGRKTRIARLPSSTTRWMYSSGNARPFGTGPTFASWQ